MKFVTITIYSLVSLIVRRPLQSVDSICFHIERVKKGIAHWDKQNNDVPAPNCMLKVQEEIIKVKGL